MFSSIKVKDVYLYCFQCFSIHILFLSSPIFLFLFRLRFVFIRSFVNPTKRYKRIQKNITVQEKRKNTFQTWITLSILNRQVMRCIIPYVSGMFTPLWGPSQQPSSKTIVATTQRSTAASVRHQHPHAFCCIFIYSFGIRFTFIVVGNKQ